MIAEALGSVGIGWVALGSSDGGADGVLGATWVLASVAAVGSAVGEGGAAVLDEEADP